MRLSFQMPAMESIDGAVRYARLANDLGYDSITGSHMASRDSFTVLSVLAPIRPVASQLIESKPPVHRVSLPARISISVPGAPNPSSSTSLKPRHASPAPTVLPGCLVASVASSAAMCSEPCRR